VVAVVVADGVGVGAADDAGVYHTSEANTLGHVASSVGGLQVPVLASLGLGQLGAIQGVEVCDRPAGFAGRARMRSVACDTLSGHWELMGTVSRTAPVVFTDGFPDELVAKLCQVWGVDSVLANRPMSGLAVLEEYGEEHLSSGRPIVYTSADSVLQVACHVDRVPVEQLWSWCEAAREVCSGPWSVGRVIARPFDGVVGRFHRVSRHRVDLTVPVPYGAWRLIHDARWPVWAVGKAGDILGHVGISDEWHADGLEDQLATTSRALEAARRAGGGLVVANVVEFDYRGHGRDVVGMASALTALDTWLGEELGRLRDGDVVIITADHGNDPTHVVDDLGREHRDHTREWVPVVVAVGSGDRAPSGGVVIGSGRDGGAGVCDMADVGVTVCSLLGVDGTVLDGEQLVFQSSGGRDDGTR
jgi:phosphopentomutase